MDAQHGRCSLPLRVPPYLQGLPGTCGPGVCSTAHRCLAPGPLPFRPPACACRCNRHKHPCTGEACWPSVLSLPCASSPPCRYPPPPCPRPRQRALGYVLVAGTSGSAVASSGDTVTFANPAVSDSSNICDTSTGVFTVPRKGLYAIKMSLCVADAQLSCAAAHNTEVFTLTLKNAQGHDLAVRASGIIEQGALQGLTIALSAELEFHAGDSFYFTLSWDGTTIPSVALSDLASDASQTTFASFREVALSDGM